MSTGRFAQRGSAFQSFAFRTWGLAGADTVVSVIASHGLVAENRTPLLIATARTRFVVAQNRHRILVAEKRT